MQCHETFVYDSYYGTGIILQRFDIYRCSFQGWNYKGNAHVTLYIPDEDGFDWPVFDVELKKMILYGLPDVTISEINNATRYQYIPYEIKESICKKHNVMHCAINLITYLFGV